MSAGIAGFFHLSFDNFRSPAFEINAGAVDTAHEGNLSSVFLNEFRNIVCGHDSLPDVDSHLDHVGNQSGRVGIAVMNDQLYAVIFVISVDLLIGGKQKFLEHSRGNKGGGLASQSS